MAFNNGHALVIGVGAYTETRLQTPKTGLNGEAITVSDAAGVANALKNPKVCAYPPEQVTFLPDAQTTKQGMTDALKQLAARTSADDTVVIFFCGHGSLGDDGQYYFGTRDVKLAGKKFAQGTGLSKPEFLELLRNVKAQKLLLIINACFSGNIGATLGPEEEKRETLGEPPPADLRMEVLATGEGRAIITASRSTQYSCFDESQPNTFFGKALIDALEGKDMPGGQFIGLYELYNALYKNVKASAATISMIQEPVLTIVDQVGPFPVALASGGGTLGVLGAGEIQQEPPGEAVVERISKAEVEKMAKNVRKGGINISGGTVSVGGDMVGGDKTVQGDEVQGDKVMGNKSVTTENIGGDKITVGNITGSKGLAIGRGASSTYTETTGVGGEELAKLFSAMNQRIDARPADPEVDKEELKETVQKIEQEVAKGDAANEGKLERWVKYLNDIAPDIIEVAATTLLNPVAGVTVALKNIIAKAQEEKG